MARDQVEKAMVAIKFEGDFGRLAALIELRTLTAVTEKLDRDTEAERIRLTKWFGRAY